MSDEKNVKLSERWGVSDPDDAARVDAWERAVDAWFAAYFFLIDLPNDGEYSSMRNLANRTEAIDGYLCEQWRKELNARRNELMNACIRAGFAVQEYTTGKFEVFLVTRHLFSSEVRNALVDEDLPKFWTQPLSSGGVLVTAR